MLRRIIAALLITLALAVPARAGDLDDVRRDFGLVAVSGPAPAFRLKTIDNRSIALADLRDRVVLLYFWATW
jgi:cytochrome oxidase Cu insertion factor (SCO1/SenC/PrrC family)